MGLGCVMGLKGGNDVRLRCMQGSFFLTQNHARWTTAPRRERSIDQRLRALRVTDDWTEAPALTPAQLRAVLAQCVRQQEQQQANAAQRNTMGSMGGGTSAAASESTAVVV